MATTVRISQTSEGDRSFYIEFFEGILRREPNFLEVLERLGQLYTLAGEHDKGLKVDRKVVRLRPDCPTAHYNLACSLSLKKRFPDALRSLQKAVELGFSDWDWLEKDPDLSGLRQRPAYKSWMTTVVV